MHDHLTQAENEAKSTSKITKISSEKHESMSTAAPAAASPNVAESPRAEGAEATSSENESAPEIDYKTAGSVYEFTVKDTNGEDVKLDKYQGKVLLIVNIASQCGLTKNNYKKLTNLKNLYAEKGLQILSFPCNQFGGQMPEADGEEMVCHLKNANADVGDVFQKVNVNGNNACPLYKYLKHKQSGTLGASIKWNFTKFLIDTNGQPIDRFASTTDPMDIAKSIEKLLN